jgi:hypothetical protein
VNEHRLVEKVRECIRTDSWKRCVSACAQARRKSILNWGLGHVSNQPRQEWQQCPLFAGCHQCHSHRRIRFWSCSDTCPFCKSALPSFGSLPHGAARRTQEQGLHLAFTHKPQYTVAHTQTPTYVHTSTHTHPTPPPPIPPSTRHEHTQARASTTTTTVTTTAASAIATRSYRMEPIVN